MTERRLLEAVDGGRIFRRHFETHEWNAEVFESLILRGELARSASGIIERAPQVDRTAAENGDG